MTANWRKADSTLVVSWNTILFEPRDEPKRSSLFVPEYIQRIHPLAATAPWYLPSSRGQSVQLSTRIRVVWPRGRSIACTRGGLVSRLPAFTRCTKGCSNDRAD